MGGLSRVLSVRSRSAEAARPSREPQAAFSDSGLFALLLRGNSRPGCVFTVLYDEMMRCTGEIPGLVTLLPYDVVMRYSSSFLFCLWCVAGAQILPAVFPCLSAPRFNNLVLAFVRDAGKSRIPRSISWPQRISFTRTTRCGSRWLRETAPSYLLQLLLLLLHKARQMSRQVVGGAVQTRPSRRPLARAHLPRLRGPLSVSSPTVNLGRNQPPPALPGDERQSSLPALYIRGQQVVVPPPLPPRLLPLSPEARLTTTTAWIALRWNLH